MGAPFDYFCHPITLSSLVESCFLEKTLIPLVVILGSALGIPQMEECPNGPCAVMFGPCVADTDCIGDNMVCSDKMKSCNPLSMITPCCNMGTVVQAALASEDLTTLVAAVTAADLVETLNGEGPFTVFAPTNDAFAKIPEETLADLLKPENVEQLTAILLRHVVPETILASEFPEEITEVNTVGGETITLDPNQATVESSAGKAKVIKTDILASNGVVHIVDTVF